MFQFLLIFFFMDKAASNCQSMASLNQMIQQQAREAVRQAMNNPNAARATTVAATANSGNPLETTQPPSWRLASQVMPTLSWLFGSQQPFAIAIGSGSMAHSNGGGAVAVANGDGARAQAVSNGGYAEAVAIGNGAVSEAAARQGEVHCDRQVIEEGGAVQNDKFIHHL